MSRPLDPEEAALWARVRASVTPLHPPAPTRAAALASTSVIATARAQERKRAATAPARPAAPRPAPLPTRVSDGTLDAGWDRRLARGLVAPDRTVDLHGHTLASAHAMLERELAFATASGARLLLLVTGRPPRKESERPHARGAIRAAVEDWIALSPYAGRVAAVRGAHQRHGGAGALYIVLRRPRTPS